MTKMKRQKVYFFMIVCVSLVGYFTLGDLGDHPEDVRFTAVSETKILRVNESSNLFKEDRVRIGESVSGKISADDKLEENDHPFVGLHEYDHLYDSPEFYQALIFVAPRSAILLTHYAQLQPSLVSSDQSKDYLNSEGYAFLSAMMTVCEKCVLGYMFYERYALGRAMSLEEYASFARSPEFNSSIEAAMSIDEFQDIYSEHVN